LDLVHLVDAKVRAARATAVRSQTVATLANEDLEEHRRWFEQQRQQSAAILKSHTTRLARERASEARRQRAQALALAAGSAGSGLLRGTVWSVTRIGTLSWLGFTQLGAFLSFGFTQLGAALWFAFAQFGAFLWLGFSQLGALLRFGASAAGAKARALWPPLVEALGAAGSQLGASAAAAGVVLDRTLRWSAARLWGLVDALVRTLRQQVHGSLEQRRRAAAAARSETQLLLLQKRIHALDKSGDGRLEPVLDEWQAFRARARKVEQELATDRRHRRGGSPWNGATGTRGGTTLSRAGTTLWRREPELPMAHLPIAPQRPVRRAPARELRPERVNPLAAR
jgi:hypothetical protein